MHVHKNLMPEQVFSLTPHSDPSMQMLFHPMHNSAFDGDRSSRSVLKALTHMHAGNGSRLLCEHCRAVRESNMKVIGSSLQGYAKRLQACMRMAEKGTLGAL